MNERKKMIVSPQGIAGTLAEIDQIRGEVAESQCESDMTRAVVMARGLNMLRQRIKGDVLKEIQQLAGTSLGFLTDRDHDDKGYPEQVIRDCAVEALIRGARLIGNEFNVIAGKCYLTKAYFERQLAELVQDLRITEGVPETHQHGALVPMTASWQLDGRTYQLDCVKTESLDNRIPVRVNKGMGVDAILGKAHRKLYARIYRQVTGSEWVSEAEPEEAGHPPARQPDAAADPDGEQANPDRDELWEKAVWSLERCQTLREIDKVERSWRQFLTPGQQELWQPRCDQRRDAIKATHIQDPPEAARERG